MTDFGTSFADAVYDQLSPIAEDDQENDYALRTFMRALGTMFQDVDWMSQDSDDGPGWSRIVNLNLCPEEDLPWLAQFIGVTVDPALSDAQKRILIANASGWNRGTVAAIMAAGQVTLTGNKVVTLIERDGDPYTLTLVTMQSETPNPAATLAAFMSEKPAGIILRYQNLDGQTYANLLANAPLYSNVFSSYATYEDALFNNFSTPTAGSLGSGTLGSGTLGG